MGNYTNKYLIRSIVFLTIIVIIAGYLYPVLQTAFLSNIYINSFIFLALIFGVGYLIYNLINLQNDLDAIKKFSFKKFKSRGKKIDSIFLKNISNEIYESGKEFTFLSSSISRVVDEIDNKLANIRENSKYLVGLLIFLGLLGTFWGLLKTIGSVGDVIGSLAVNDTNIVNFFDSLKQGLNEPLKGMSIAFSSSLFGLAGSLILGFIDLQMGHSQSNFLETLEKFMRNNSSPSLTNISDESSDSNTTIAIQKLYDNLGNLTYSLQETSQNQEQIFSYIKSLTENLNNLVSLVQDQDKKLSSFLTTQLNTQSSMLQLTTKLSQEGVMDAESKKHLKNLDQGIQKLISGIKKSK